MISISIVMGSKSDLDDVRSTFEVLDEFNVEY